jgi:hypothetical protein
MDALFILASQYPFLTDIHDPDLFDILTGYFIAYTFIIRKGRYCWLERISSLLTLSTIQQK